MRDQLPDLGSDRDADFDYVAFQGDAQRLIDSAVAADRPVLQARVTCLLASAGLIPSETEGEPCPAESAPGLNALDGALRELEADIPRLQAEYGDQFWAAFAGQADVIEDHAGANAAYVESRISQMLVARGLQSEDDR